MPKALIRSAGMPPAACPSPARSIRPKWASRVGGHVPGALTPGGTGKLVFDMSTFEADTAQARRYVGLDADFSASDARKVNANMRGPEVLDVKRYPQAAFAMTSMKPLDGQAPGAIGKYELSGQFTLHGVTHPIQFTATLANVGARDVLSLQGQFTIAQSSYGIKPFSAAAGVIGIEDELTIYGGLFLRPKQ